MARRPEARGTPVRLTALTAVAALLVTLAVITLPFLRFAYRAPELHVALETTAALTALVLAFLVYGRFRSSGSLQELLLSLSLGIVAVVNLLLAMLPSSLDFEGAELRDWTAVALRLLGTLLLVAAAMTATRSVGDRRTVRLLLAGLVCFVVAVLGVLVSIGDLPPAVQPDVDVSDAGRPLVEGHWLVLVSHATGAVAYAVAAVAFTRQARNGTDQLLRWLGAACVLAAFSRVHYFLFPSLYSDYVYAGDLMRLGFYVLLLIGAAREVQSYWQARAEAAVLEDRRRMARDLHDGLTQELSYIWSQTRRLSKAPGDAQLVEHIGGAAGRALDESRRAISALTRPLDETFDRVLHQQVDEMAHRYDVTATTRTEPGVVVTPQQGEDLLRIMGEAFRNAVRHGQAAHVDVELCARPLRLVVRDDGHGFDPARAASSGFGLVSMRERAEGLGARFSVASAASGGTSVKVEWT